MSNFFTRLFNIGRAKANEGLDAIENPHELLKLKLVDLKSGYASSMKGLAQVKALEVTYRKKVTEFNSKSADYLGKAQQIKARIDGGEWKIEDHEGSIVLMLNKKENMANEAKSMLEKADNQLKIVTNLKNKIGEMKNLIDTTESQIINLKAQAEAAKVNKNVSKELSDVNFDSAAAQIAEIERKIAADNAEGEAWTSIADDMEDEEAKIERLLKESSPTSDNDLLKDFMAK